jgi:hypothetical protein
MGRFVMGGCVEFLNSPESVQFAAAADQVRRNYRDRWAHLGQRVKGKEPLEAETALEKLQKDDDLLNAVLGEK